MADNGDKKKRKSKFVAFAAKRKRGDSIPLGRQGFLITCDGGREHQCARECINLLDQFHEKLSGGDGDEKTISNPPAADEPKDEQPEKEGDEAAAAPEESQNEKSGNEEKEKNIEDLLEAEISELRDKDKRRFADLSTGCNGVVFIDMLRGSVGPVELAEAIVRSVAETKKSRTRFCMKLLPVETTCYASPEEVKLAAQPLISKHFPEEADESRGLKFAVAYESRANTGLDRMKMINAVAELVPKPHRVDLKSPEKTIIVQVAKTACTIGVVNNFKELSKYNLRQLVLPPGNKEEHDP